MNKYENKQFDFLFHSAQKRKQYFQKLILDLEIYNTMLDEDKDNINQEIRKVFNDRTVLSNEFVRIDKIKSEQLVKVKFVKNKSYFI